MALRVDAVDVPPVQQGVGHRRLGVQRQVVLRHRIAGAAARATCSPSSATRCPFSSAPALGDAATVASMDLGTRTRKRGDRRRRCTRGRSRAVVGMAANPSGAHQAGRHWASRARWSVPSRAALLGTPIRLSQAVQVTAPASS